MNLETTGFICADGDYTTGNLGKTWNELDLVPHRLTTESGTQSDVTTTYTIGITADNEDAGHPGYDVLAEPIVNDGKSDASCAVSAGAEQHFSPGVGGIDTSLGRLFTITQDPGTTCVFDWVERLALGSHLFPGSSLHTNRTNQAFSTSGIGAADVSIPVKEILPQELSKDMSATQGQAYSWDVQKSASPTSLNFANTCLSTAGARSAQVQITVSWTRSGPTASGNTTVTTNIYATNPAHRTITVQATDKIYEGSAQTNLLDTFTTGAVDVDAGTKELIGTHTFSYPGSATSFNDVATATYTDKVTGINVPGTTQAVASATTKAASGTPANASVTVSDSESITGAGLAFSVAAPSVGAFTGGYTAGTSTTGPVNWSAVVTDSGSVTFTKTVTVDQARITSGSLSDTATIKAGDNTLDSASANVAITADADVNLTINKTIPAGALRSGESVTFNFNISGPSSYSGTASITFNYGDPTTKSVTLSNLENPGSYTVSEVAKAGWASQSDKTVDITLPNCSGSVTFNNTQLAPSVSASKTADDDSVTAGSQIGFVISVSNSSAAGTGTAKDVTISDPLPAGDGIDWEIAADSDAGCSISGALGSETLSCSFGDMAPGASVSVHVVSDTTLDSCGAYRNVATIGGSNFASLERSDTTTVNCPDISVEKSTTTPVVNAGDVVSFDIAVAAGGTGDSTNVTLTDNLPAGVSWSVSGTDAAACSIDSSGDPDVLTCHFGTIANGSSRSVTLTGTADKTTCPLISNTATVDSAVNADDSNDSSTARITVNCGLIDIEKTPDGGVVTAGGTATFTLTVSNKGDGTAKGVSVSDQLPDVSGTWTPDNANCSVNSSDLLSCSLGDMASGASITVKVSTQVTADDCGLLDNPVASASTTNDGTDSDSGSITVDCPNLTVEKSSDNGTIVAGDLAGYTITVTNAGPGTAQDVHLDENVPDGLSWVIDSVDPSSAGTCASSVSTEQPQSITCDFDSLAAKASVTIHLSAVTTRAACRTLHNVATVSGSNEDPTALDDNEASADVVVRCPTIAIQKTNDQTTSVLPGTVVTYTLSVTVKDGPAASVTVVDTLPDGLEAPEHITDSGVWDATARTITWNFASLATDEYPLSYQAAVSADVANGTTLKNVAVVTGRDSQCPDLETLGPDCTDDSTVTTRVPTLVIDKSADTDLVSFHFDANGNLLTVTPAAVTWTLTWTLANGPVTNAVISDPLPAFVNYVDGSASDGGSYDSASRTLTWTYATLTAASGSVTFKTTVDPDAPETGPITNVTTIDSAETAPDQGVDSIRVTSDSELASTGTPQPSLPNTALGSSSNGQPLNVPVWLMLLIFGGSLGSLVGLGAANLVAVRRRR